MSKFKVKKQIEQEVVPETIKELITFLVEQEYRLSQASYELGNDLQSQLEAIEEDEAVPEEMYEEIYELVENSGITQNAVNCGDQAAGEVQELIDKLKGEDKK